MCTKIGRNYEIKFFVLSVVVLLTEDEIDFVEANLNASLQFLNDFLD